MIYADIDVRASLCYWNDDVVRFRSIIIRQPVKIMQWIHRLCQAIKLLYLRAHFKASRRQDVGLYEFLSFKSKRGTSQCDLFPEFPNLGLSQNLSNYRSLRMPIPGTDRHNSNCVHNCNG